MEGNVYHNSHMDKTVTATEARNDFFAILKAIRTPGGHRKNYLRRPSCRSLNVCR